MFRWNMKHSQWIRWVVFNPQLQRTDSVPQLNNQWWFDADLSKTWYRQAGKRWWLLVGLFHDRLIRMPPSSVPNFPSPITFLSNYPKIQWITPNTGFYEKYQCFSPVPVGDVSTASEDSTDDFLNWSFLKILVFVRCGFNGDAGFGLN